MLLNGITCSTTVGALWRSIVTLSCCDDYVVVVRCSCRLLNDNWRCWCRLSVLLSHHLHHHLLLEHLLLLRHLLLHLLLGHHARLTRLASLSHRRHRGHHHWLLHLHHIWLRRWHVSWHLRRLLRRSHHHWHAHTWLALRCSQILHHRIWCLYLDLGSLIHLALFRCLI